jgi:hypothetical protein
VARNSGYHGLAFGAGGKINIRTGTAAADGDAFVGVRTHVVITFDGVDAMANSRYKVFLNGISVPLYTASSLGVTTNATNIGYAYTATSQWLGEMNFFRYYTEALTPEQVIALFAAR